MNNTESLAEFFKEALDEVSRKSPWNVYEFLEVMVMYKFVDDDEPDDALFYGCIDEYLKELLKGIKMGQVPLVPGVKKDPPSPYYFSWKFGLYYNVREFISVVLGERIKRLSEKNRILDLYIFPSDAVEFAISRKWLIPEKFQALRKVHSSAILKVEEKPTSLDKAKIISESRRDAGKQKGKIVRVFTEQSIKARGRREIEKGCTCLHRDLAGHLHDEIISEAKAFFDPKKLYKILENIDYLINDALKDLFYECGEKYQNVQARVFRGKFYDPLHPPLPCKVHKHRK